MKKNPYLLAFAGVMALSTSAFSQAVVAEEKADAATEETSPWTSSVELGFISTTGNTENTTSALKADVVYEVDKWRHAAHAEAYGQESTNDKGEKEVAAERYELTGQSDYKFNEHDYAFALAKLKNDRFSGFDYEHSLSLGYGRKVILRETMELDLEIGPGMKFFREDDQTAQDEAILRLAAKYWWAITDTSKFTQDLISEIGESFTTTESITGIQASISDNLALKFTYTIRYKDEVPVGIEKKDTEAAMTLVYNF